mgnify:CR=1 FL=1
MYRSTIKDKIIPHAVSWYTGEALQGEEFEEEAEEDDGEEEDDEDEDEDEDDEEDDDEETTKVSLFSVEAKFPSILMMRHF